MQTPRMRVLDGERERLLTSSLPPGSPGSKYSRWYVIAVLLAVVLIVTLALLAGFTQTGAFTSVAKMIPPAGTQFMGKYYDHHAYWVLHRIHRLTFGKSSEESCKMFNFIAGVHCNTTQNDTFFQCPHEVQSVAQAFNGSELSASARSAIYEAMIRWAKDKGLSHCVPPSLCGVPKVVAEYQANVRRIADQGAGEKRNATRNASMRGQRLCDGGYTRVYHVTTRWACRNILKKGFDLKYSAPGSLGEGIYFSRSLRTAAWRTRHYGCVIIAAVRFGSEKRLSCSGPWNGCERGWTWLEEWQKRDPTYGKALVCNGYDSLHSWKHGPASAIFFPDQVVDMVAYPTCSWKGCSNRNGGYLNGRNLWHVAKECNPNAFQEKCHFDNVPDSC